MDRIVNNIWLAQNLMRVLRTQWTLNPTVKFSKYVVILSFFCGSCNQCLQPGL